jgi:hypothetical protein
MSGKGDNAENRRKTFFLLASIGIIAVAFASIIGLFYYIGLLDDIKLPFVSAQNGTEKYTPDSLYSNMTTVNGVTRISMMKAMDVVKTTERASRWTADLPDWFICNGRAEFVDGQGLAQRWTLAMRTDNSILVAVLTNGEIESISVQDLLQVDDTPANETDDQAPGGIIDQYPGYNYSATTTTHARDNLFDTGYAMKLTLKETGVNMPLTSMPFTITYDDDGDVATYTIQYVDAVTPSQSFVVKLDAVSGYILRSDRGVTT